MGNKALSLASLKAISVCIINGISPFYLAILWNGDLGGGQFPSNSIKTHEQQVLGRMGGSNVGRYVPGGVPIMNAAHGFSTHVCEVRLLF